MSRGRIAVPLSAWCGAAGALRPLGAQTPFVCAGTGRSGVGEHRFQQGHIGILTSLCRRRRFASLYFDRASRRFVHSTQLGLRRSRGAC